MRLEPGHGYNKGIISVKYNGEKLEDVDKSTFVVVGLDKFTYAKDKDNAFSSDW